MGSYPRPRGAHLGLLVALFVPWLVLALGANWLSLPASVPQALVGSSQGVLSGEVWRLVTAGFVHTWSGRGAVTHLLFNLLVLYFFGTTLHERWGDRRYLVFALGSLAFSFALQALVGSLITRLDTPYWYGAGGLCDAFLVAWALSAREGERVMFYFVLPISPKAILFITLALNVLYVVALGPLTEGLVTPFGGMLAGWLFGASESPVRKLWLRMKLRRLQRQAAELAVGRAREIAKKQGGSGLRVIEGGKSKKPSPRDLN
jgi:membrane associated rhomboid family serine protease